MKNSFGPERKIFNSLVRRCVNPKDKSWPRYGGAGVTVCDEWRYGSGDKTAFEMFIEHVGPRPSSKHSIDRIDNWRGYEPGNVRWATILEQANNKKNSHWVIYQGERMTLAQATRKANRGVPNETVANRVRRGWSVLEAVEVPLLFRREPGTRKKIRVGAE